MLELKNISFSYNKQNQEYEFSLKNVSFCLNRGEKIALMGANGSGKSTLIRCINGLLKPDKGQVIVDGVELVFPDTVLEIRKKVGMVFQYPDNQIVTTSVEREIAFGLENIGTGKREMDFKVQKAMEQFHLGKYRTRPPHLLSGGERQRLALASVLVMEPDYLILDEPTSLLDPAGREEILSTITAQAENEKKGVILVTQFPEEALEFDRVVILDSGEIVMQGTPDQVFSETDKIKSVGLDVPVKTELGKYLKELISGY